MMECRHHELIRRLASLAKIRISDEELESICKDLERTAEFLRTVSDISKNLDVNPLYYVWDNWGPLREPGEQRKVDISDLPVHLKDGYVKVPWRGGRLEKS